MIKEIFIYSKFFPDTDCYEVGINYPKNDLKRNTNVFSVGQCFIMCLNLDGCLYFTFQPSNNTCWLKNNITTGQPLATVISGGLPMCKGDLDVL